MNCQARSLHRRLCTCVQSMLSVMAGHVTVLAVNLIYISDVWRLSTRPWQACVTCKDVKGCVLAAWPTVALPHQ